MFTAYIVVSIFTAAANTYAAIVDFRRLSGLSITSPSGADRIRGCFPWESSKPQARLGS